jgi:hypothetical protein
MQSPAVSPFFVYILRCSDHSLYVACTADLGSRLFWLNLRGTRVTDAGLKHLEGLSELIGLAMEGSRVSPGGMAEFRKVLPDVLFIEVGSSPATFDFESVDRRVARRWCLLR